ncbi:hypothetical protein RvVAT039_02870 [Agrobacterium vitis]|uniref:hypothetical protein n=1 Tax=Agrobacterium vitis TaxID=373 RepID=UPI0012E78861|nr:hypothetical protein [Agrobacterium vitis]MVA73176.1 hypothetical protein [Agrobacterium vitis]BCH63071.1 hypothetical protein RvVAT039_02870 [Agrobacterium vitis]
MNRFLARTLSALNILFALLIITIAAASGATRGMYYTGELSIPGAVLGGLGGILVAALVCGTIAFLTLIERHLSVLADAAKRGENI